MSLDQFMRRLAALTIIILIGVLSWIIGSRWNADAIALLVGVIFGWLGGIPTALLIIAQDRRKRAEPAPPPAPREFQLIDPATGQIAPYIMRERLPAASEVTPWIAFGSTSSHS
jgi:hypothetical protein